MNIQVITDCTGTKFNAIQGVFNGYYKKPASIVEVCTIKPNMEVKTPLIRDLFLTSLQNRVGDLLSKDANRHNRYAASIQRGYFFESGGYHLGAIVGISYNSTFIHAYTSTVPIDDEVSQKKWENPELNIGTLLAEKFSKFKKGSSVFEFLTEGEDEMLWFQQPLRYCLKELLR